MRVIKKTFLFIIFMFLFALFFNVGSCYANTLQTKIDESENGNYGVGNTYVLGGENTIFAGSENFYCISKDKGSDGTDSTKYEVISFFKIRRKVTKKK